jgi:capsular polysaccharide biosynthesis protein
MKKIKIHNKFNSVRTKPVNLKKEDIYLFENEFYKSFKGSYMLFAKNVSINFLDLSKYFRLISFSRHTKMNKFNFYQNLKYFFMKSNVIESDQVVAKGSWILDEKSFHYFHWMCDALPRLVQIKNYTEEYPVLIPDKFMKYRFIKESLQEFDVNYKIYNASKKLNVRKLLISSHVAPSGNYKKDIMLKINEVFCKKYKLVRHSKIWISREKSKHRKIINESKIKNILDRYGYRIIYPEDFSFNEQTKIFSEAKVVAGLHGGGLTNIIYLKENCILFEIRREGDVDNNCYFTLASDLGLKYYYLNSQKLGNDLYVDNVNVDINDFERILEKIEDEII